MHKAVFLDRDGTINEEMGYINHPSRFKVFDFTYEAIRILNNAGFLVFVITNQSGLARGYFEEPLLLQIHSQFLKNVEEQNGRIEKIYYCPHHKDGIISGLAHECNCRKPKPGMLLQAKDEYNLSLQNSYMIGDRYKDIEFGRNNGLTSIMVMTGYGRGEYTYQRDTWQQLPEFTAENLLQAARLIEKNET